MKNESQWLDELLFIRRNAKPNYATTSHWWGYVQRQARLCQFPDIAQAMLECLNKDEMKEDA